MSATHLGIFVGATLALSWVVFGFWAFLFVAAAMTVGAGVGRVLEGRLDLSGLVDAVRGKRSSS